MAQISHHINLLAANSVDPTSAIQEAGTAVLSDLGCSVRNSVSTYFYIFFLKMVSSRLKIGHN
jgi:hypothetical protein